MIKKIFCLIPGLLLSAFLLFVACNKSETIEETVYAPTLTVSTAMIKASSEGGPYSFTYTIANPSEDGIASCETDAEWISALDSGTGTVNLTVDENSSTDIRTGHIIFSYFSSFGTESETVTVVQGTGDDPELTVSPTAVAAEIEGGVYSFSYTITNPSADGELTCATEADWISDLDWTVEGTVSFTVAENEESTLREGVISVVYIYGNGQLDESVTVFQDHIPAIGGGDDVSDEAAALVGTYSCSGIVSNRNWDHTADTEPGIQDTWTLKIYATGGNKLILSGLVPEISSYYDEGYEFYIADGTVSDGVITVYPQFTGYYSDDGSGGKLYICWALCTGYFSNETADEENEAGWYYSSSLSKPCLFTYDSETGIWTSDYGLFLGLSTKNSSLSGFAQYIDAFAPGMTFTKTSDTL